MNMNNKYLNIYTMERRRERERVHVHVDIAFISAHTSTYMRMYVLFSI